MFLSRLSLKEFQMIFDNDIYDKIPKNIKDFYVKINQEKNAMLEQ